MSRFKPPRRQPGDLTSDEQMEAAHAARQRAASPADPGDADDHPEERAPDGDLRRELNTNQSKGTS